MLRVDGRLLERVTPNTIAFERDLYRVEGFEGIEPNDFEKGFSGLEGAFVAVRNDIETSDALPPPASQEFEILLEYIALTLVRGPLLRERINASLVRMADEAFKEMTASPETFRERVESARAHGLDLPTDPEALEQLRTLRFADFKVTVPNFVFMQALFRGLESVRAPLAARSWQLYRAGEAEFITCDRPVSVFAEDPGAHGRFSTRPDLWSPQSDVAFPLTRDLMVVGTAADHRERGRAVVADRRRVAALNAYTISRAIEFYCWSGGEFVYLMPNGEVGDLAQFMDALSDVRGA